MVRAKASTRRSTSAGPGPGACARARRRRRGRRRPGAAGREPALEDRIEVLAAQRLAEVVVHARGEAALTVAGEGVRGHRHDRDVATLGLRGADLRGRLVPVEVRHLAVHEDRVMALGVEPPDGFDPSDARSTAIPRRSSSVSITIWLTGLSSATRTRPRWRRGRGGLHHLGLALGLESTSASVSSSAARRTGLESERPRPASGARRPTSASRSGWSQSGSPTLARATSAPPSSGISESTRTTSYGRPARRRHQRQRLHPVGRLVAQRHAPAEVCDHDLAVRGVSSTTSTRVAGGIRLANGGSSAPDVDDVERDLEAERAALAPLGLGGQLAAHHHRPAGARSPAPARSRRSGGSSTCRPA